MRLYEFFSFWINLFSAFGGCEYIRKLPSNWKRFFKRAFDDVIAVVRICLHLGRKERKKKKRKNAENSIFIVHISVTQQLRDYYINSLFIGYLYFLTLVFNISLFFSASSPRLNEPNWSGFQGGAPQLQWLTAPSQYGTSSINGGLIGGSSNNISNNAGHSNQHSRVVVINRDERGFGFVVAGDNPVFVQTVREGSSNTFFLSFPSAPAGVFLATMLSMTYFFISPSLFYLSLLMFPHLFILHFRMIIGRIWFHSFVFVLLSFFWFSLVSLPLFFMFIGGAAERAGIFKDDIIIKVFS